MMVRATNDELRVTGRKVSRTGLPDTRSFICSNWRKEIPTRKILPAGEKLQKEKRGRFSGGGTGSVAHESFFSAGIYGDFS
jgi:hypothetical protein